MKLKKIHNQYLAQVKNEVMPKITRIEDKSIQLMNEEEVLKQKLVRAKSEAEELAHTPYANEAWEAVDALKVRLIKVQQRISVLEKLWLEFHKKLNKAQELRNMVAKTIREYGVKESAEIDFVSLTRENIVGKMSVPKEKDRKQQAKMARQRKAGVAWKISW